jgi:hypothetical protein
MSETEELEELIYLLQHFREAHCNEGGAQNYQVHVETTIMLVETRLLALLRNEKNEQLQQLDSLKHSVLMSKPSKTDRRTSLRSADPTTELYLGYMPPGSQSPSEKELLIAQ